jgi:hypothetical protein
LRCFFADTSSKGDRADGQRPEDFASLSDEARRDVESRQQELGREVARRGRKQQEIMRDMERDIQLIERRFCESLLIPIVNRMKEELKNEEWTAPTYLNLFGTIDRVVDRFGRVVTNFTGSSRDHFCERTAVI